jgi:hypothetical protein
VSSPGTSVYELAELPAAQRQALEQIEAAQHALIARLDEPDAPNARGAEGAGRARGSEPRWKKLKGGQRSLTLPGIATFLPTEYEADGSDWGGRLAGFLFFSGLSALAGAAQLWDEHDVRIPIACGLGGLVLLGVAIALGRRSNRADALREGRVVLLGGLYLLPDGVLYRGSADVAEVTQFFPRAAILGFAYEVVGNRGARYTTIRWRDADGAEQRQPALRSDARAALERWRRAEGSV